MTIDQERQERLAPSRQLSLPTDFLWGASTSAYQIEGATRTDGRGPSIWDDFAALPGKIRQGANGDIACASYARMQEDVDLMAAMGLNAYCFSISWPRVLPAGRGALNQPGLDFYERLVDALLAKGITPVAKLYHWDLPSALQAEGGWATRSTAYAFADYAEIVAQRLGDRVDYWLTQNEPWCIAYLGHIIGIHAPGLKDAQLGITVGHHVLLSHGLAVPRIRAHTRPSAQVGITIDYYPMHGANELPETREALLSAEAFRNRWFLEPLFKKRYPERLFADLGVAPPPMQPDDFEIIATPIDFLGLNYYSRWLVQSPSAGNGTRYEQITHIPDASYTMLGWEIYPQGLLETLQQVQRDYAPPAIIVTENGAAFLDAWDGEHPVRDLERTRYLRQHVQYIEQAVAEGIPVKGYFVWSLLDNFEWAEGYGPRFGLVYVDFPSQRRVIKESGHWYTSFIASKREKDFVRFDKELRG